MVVGDRASRTRRVEQVVDYNPEWPEQFCRLRDKIWPSVCDIATAIEHVGSTSVPGLAAKPIIDLDVVVPTPTALPEMVIRLGLLGYEHQRNLGINDREAFSSAANPPAHNLYVCPREGVTLQNHLALRDHLRSHPSDAAAYSGLKQQLAKQFAHDINSYVEGKTEFILSILRQYGLSADRLDSIRCENRR